MRYEAGIAPIQCICMILSFFFIFIVLCGLQIKNGLRFSQGPIDYGGFKPASVRFQLVLNQALLRAMQVADILSDGDNGQDCNQGEKRG